MIYRGVVTKVTTYGAMVRLSAFSLKGEFGPMPIPPGLALATGDPVICGSVGGRKEDLIILSAQGGDTTGVALDDLSDVVITTPATGALLYYNGSEWVDRSPVLDDNTDVVLTAPANGDYLKYNGSNWVNAVFPITNLDSLSDVVISSAATRDVLRYNGSAWVDAALEADDIQSGTFAIARIPTGTSGTTVSLGNHTHGTTGIDDDAVTNAKLADMAQSTIKGRASGAGTGDPTDLTQTQVVTILNSGASTPANVATAASSGSATSLSLSDHAHALAANVVTNAKMATMATQTFKGRATAGTGDPEDLTLAQARDLIQQPNMVMQRFVRGSSINTTSTSFADISGASVSFVKRHASSKVMLQVMGTWFFNDGSGAGGGGYIALNINSTDVTLVTYPLAVPSNLRVSFAGADTVSGLAAGTYTVQARWRAQTSGKQVNMNITDDWITIMVMEYWN